jgi:Leucine-rich repeat (LRR) protein
MSLQYLILSQNHIVQLQENTITNLTNLISLQLINNSLLHLNSNSIRNLPSLTHLYLRDNRLTEVPTDFLSMIPYLTFLTLNKNNISGIDQFAFVLETDPLNQQTLLIQSFPNYHSWLYVDFLALQVCEVNKG